MRKGWTLPAIGEIASCTLGKMLDRQKNKGTPQPYLRNSNVRWFGFDLTDLLEMRFLDGEAERFTAIRGDVLVCEGGYPGRAAIWNEDYPIHFQKAIHRVRFHEPDRNHWFLYYLFAQEASGALEKHFTGTGIRHFTGAALSRLRIPLPPLAEQKRIVAILDEAFAGIDAAIANAEKNLASARELFESYLNTVFTRQGEGWVETTVAKVADHSLGKMLDKQKNQGMPRPYLRNLNVRWFEFDLSDVLEMRFEDTEVERYTVRRGDVVICEGGYPGRAAIWDRGEPMFFQKALHRVRFDQPNLNRWFLYFLYLSHATGGLRKYFTGAGIQHFTGQALARFRLPIAPPEVTDRYVEEFDSLMDDVRRIEGLYQRKLAALAELKQSVLRKAFSGKLTTDAAAA